MLDILGVLHTSWAGAIGAVLSALGILLALWPLDSQMARQKETEAVTSLTPPQLPPRKISLWARREKGPLHVVVGERLRHSTIVLYRGFHQAHRQPVAAASVSERLVDGETLYVATFPQMDPGNYTVASQNKEYIAIITVYAGLPAWVDLR